MSKTIFLLSMMLFFIVSFSGMNVLGVEESTSEPPIVIQAEDYIECGIDAAFDVNSPELNFSLDEQLEGVKIHESNDIDGGYHVENIGKNKWLAYMVTIPQSGWYSVNARVASVNDGAFRMTIGGKNYVRTQAFPATGESLVWKTINIPAVYLPGGTDVMRFISEEDNLNVNWISITMTTQTPYSGYAAIVPGCVEAEEYDWGGQGVAYSDTTPGNICYYAAFRFEDVDVENSPVSGPSLINVEWMEYIIYAQYTGTYYPRFVVAAPYGGSATLTFWNYWSGTFSFSTSGGNQSYQEFPTSWVDLYQGTYLVRVTARQDLWNFDKLIFYYMPFFPQTSEQMSVYDPYRLDKPFPLAIEESLELK